MANPERRFPLWIVTGCAFVLIFAVVIAYFFWHSANVRRTFLNHVHQNALLVSEVVKLNAGATLVFQKSIEDIFSSLLGNTARFVSYLDDIEPFVTEELTVFAKEAGLAGISIQRGTKPLVHAPRGWLSDESLAGLPMVSGIQYLKQENLFVLIRQMPDDGGRVVILGVDGSDIAAITERLGIDAIVSALTRVPGISYVRVEASRDTGAGERGPVIRKFQGRDVAEARQSIGTTSLVVGVDAGYLSASIREIKVRFAIFSICLVMTGLCLSLLLHRYQKEILRRVQAFEREIAVQKEEAILGRSAATIAHEVRNPLNALGMGLQRLDMESTELSGDHRRLIGQMLDAVKRANSSVTGLLDFSRRRDPETSVLGIGHLVDDVLALYRQQYALRNIRIAKTAAHDVTVSTDPGMMAQVIENIVKNSLEAQTEGGFLNYGVEPEGRMVVLRFSNGGCTVSPEDAHLIFEPYFTRRTDGTGLGMAIVKKLMRALGGRIEIDISGKGVIETRLYVPKCSAQAMPEQAVPS